MQALRETAYCLVTLFLTLCAASLPALAQDPRLAEQAAAALKRAAEYYRQHAAAHGGYVYHYSLDFRQRWGEGEASPDQIWVQPPGTPTVGLAYLRAYEATGDRFYLEAASAAARALVHGQLKSGGWTNCIDFDPQGTRVAEYRNGRGRGKNNSSLDDGQTPSAIRLLVRADRALEQTDAAIHEAAGVALDALLAAQFPHGGFPQVWTGPVAARPVLAANYPDHDWRTEGRVKNYWDMATLNDNVAGYVAEALIDAWEVYREERFLKALRRLGDFLLLAQMPEPQPGWAQQYNDAMQPIWARKFEPPAVAGDETQEVLATLLRIHQVTGDRKYLEPMPRALAWLRRSLLADGRLARYYELRTNRPLYMERRGDDYRLTYDDGNLPAHYGWKFPSRIEQLDAAYQSAVAGRAADPPGATPETSRNDVRRIIDQLDTQGRWVSTYAGERLVGQPKFSPGQQYLSSEVFSQNVEALSAYLRP